MSDLPALTEEDIRTWTDTTSYARGRSYFEQGRIFNPRRQGQSIKGQCEGSSAPAYTVAVTLSGSGILSGMCSCPVGGGGRCKHAVALLLTWLDDPAAFVEVEDLSATLEKRSKEELITLIRQMIACYPDLENLAALPVPGQPVEPGMAADLIRRQVKSVLFGMDDDWAGAYAAGAELSSLVGIGSDYLQHQDYASAAVTFQAIAAEILDVYEMIHEENGEISGIVYDCVTGLGECLAAIDAPAARQVILRSLFDFYSWDVAQGGIGIADGVPTIILDQATPGERQEVGGWVREALPDVMYWGKMTHGRFILELEADMLDDEAYLRICREAGLVTNLVIRLLALERPEEAAAAARATSDYELLLLADVLVEQGHLTLAHDLVAERAQTGQDPRLLPWLKDKAQQRRDPAEVLRLQELIFWREPSVENYTELKDLARQVGQWQALQPSLMQRLAQEDKQLLLIGIYVQENDAGAALRLLQQMQASAKPWYYGPAITMQVARVAEADFPLEAVRLYIAEVQNLINGRGRENYRQAAGYLVRVRDIYRRLGQDETWQALIARLRGENRTLPALKQELLAAGL